MKKLKLIGKSAVLAIAFVMASSCGSDDGGTGTGGNSGSYLKGKVDGQSFNAAIMGQSTVTAIRVGSGETTLISVSGSSPDLDAMQVALYGVTTTGTYEINANTESNLAYVVTGSGQSYDTSDCENATGTVTVTELTETYIKGTYSFTGRVDENCSQSKTITNGTFRGVFMQN